MSKIHISEQKARKIIRSLIENHMDFDSEAVRNSSRSIRNLDDYFNIMVDEIDNHHLELHDLNYQVREMQDKVRESIGEFMIMWSEIKHSDLDNERKELLRERMLSYIKYQQGLERRI
jgi:hypothetical protein